MSWRENVAKMVAGVQADFMNSPSSPWVWPPPMFKRYAETSQDVLNASRRKRVLREFLVAKERTKGLVKGEGAGGRHGGYLTPGCQLP